MQLEERLLARKGRAIVPCGEQCCVRWWPREGKAGPSFPCQDIGFCGGSPNCICGSMAERGETVTPRSPAIWRWQRIDQGELVCHLPEVCTNLSDHLGSKTICALVKNEESAILGFETTFYDSCLCNSYTDASCRAR